MQDLLQFIETRLLRINSENRAKCDETVEKLSELHDACSDSQYCLKRLKKIPLRSTTNSSLLTPVALELSPETERKINRNPLPVFRAGMTHTSFKDFAESTTTHQEADGMYTETSSLRSISPRRTSPHRPQNFSPLQSISNNSDPQLARPLSPLKEVHYIEEAPQDKAETSRDLHDIPAEETPTETTSSTFTDRKSLETLAAKHQRSLSPSIYEVKKNLETSGRSAEIVKLATLPESPANSQSSGPQDDIPHNLDGNAATPSEIDEQPQNSRFVVDSGQAATFVTSQIKPSAGETDVAGTLASPAIAKLQTPRPSPRPSSRPSPRPADDTESNSTTNFNIRRSKGLKGFIHKLWCFDN